MGPQFLHVGFGIFTANNSLLCFLGHSRSPFDSKRLLARLLRSTIYSSLIDAIGFRNAFHANSSPDFRQQLLIKASRMLTSVIEKPRVLRGDFIQQSVAAVPVYGVRKRYFLPRFEHVVGPTRCCCIPDGIRSPFAAIDR